MIVTGLKIPEGELYRAIWYEACTGQWWSYPSKDYQSKTLACSNSGPQPRSKTAPPFVGRLRVLLTRGHESKARRCARACGLVSDAAALSRLLRSGKLRGRCATFEVAFLQRIEIGFSKHGGPGSRNGIQVSRGLRGEAGGEMASKSTSNSTDCRRRSERENRNLERARGKIPLRIRGRSAPQGKIISLEIL